MWRLARGFTEDGLENLINDTSTGGGFLTYFRVDLEEKCDIKCANVLKNLPEVRFETFKETLDHLWSELSTEKLSPHF